MGLFVSYSSRERAAIDQLTAALRRAREEVWLDEELGGGETWWRKILEEIRGCEVFIFCLSKNSLESKPCQAELRYAQALQRQILPVQIGPVDSMRVNPVASVQVIDFQDPTLDQGIQLISAIHAHRRLVQPLPSPLPDEPPVPFAYLMRLGSTITGPDLTARQQSQLVSELKSGLDEDGDDVSARRDIMQLLCALRDRSDVTWRTRNEIDTVLASIDSDSSASTSHHPSSTPQAFERSPGTSPTLQANPPAAPPQSWYGPGPGVAPNPAMGARDGPGPPPPPFTGPQPIPMPPPGPRFGPDGGAKQRGPSRKRLIIAGAGALAVIVVVVVVAVVAGSSSDSGTRATTTSATPVPTVTPARLDSILLSAVDVNALMGASNMQAGEIFSEMDSGVLTLSNPDCRGSIDVVAAPVYQGSGYTAISGRVVKEPGTNNDHLVAQTAVSFPAAAQADAFLKTSTDKWKSCAGQVVTKTDSGTSYRWSVGDVTAQDAKLTVLNTQEDANGWACQHALGTVSNVVIDVNACSYRTTNEGSQVVDKMVAKATQ